MSEYDSNLVFCNLEELQQTRGMVDPSTGDRAVTSIQVKLKNFEDAETVVERPRGPLSPPTSIRSAPGSRNRDRCWPPSNSKPASSISSCS
ncbi:MAG: hypothetical protein Ct9H300mP1_10680 [Planctomycetaceae bacterium]|nr:MAG: hypothetical protein Ct9H300mP1_10680 [Planctomycetaceae bacterium]